MAVIHREEGDNEFMNIIASELTPRVSLLCESDCAGPLYLVIVGNVK